MDKTKESLSIRLLDSHSNPLKNQEFRLFEVQNGRRSIINTIFTSNENGEAFFNAKEVFKEGTQSFEIGLHNTLCYKRKPIYNHRYLLRNYEYGYLCEVKFAKKADDASIEKVTLKPKEYLLDNNEKIILKFYAGGDIVELEAFYDVTKIQEDEIKWGYTLLTASSQEHSKNREHSKNLDTLNKNQLTNDKKDSSLFDDKISTTCCHIEKRGDIAILSGTPIDMMQDNPQVYRGKTIQIALPKTTHQQTLLIFAYKNTPNYRASQLIRLNDYPQITIDCTLAETLRAYTKQDSIATLGWGVSYICQRLWHDNPANAKSLSELIYRDSHSPDFIESIPNATMQSIVKEVLPRITLKEFSKDSNNKCPAITSQIQEIKDKNLRFYVELDWDRFYMQFPLMKNLEKEMLSIYLAPTTYGYQGIPNPILPTYNGKILTKGFLAQIHKLMENKKEILKNTQKTESMQVTANLLEIAKNPKEANIPNANNKIFSITNDSTKLQECEKLLSDIKPSDLGRYQMQYYEFSDIAFGKEYMLNALNEKSNQAIALYALSGKFQIYYVLDSFEVERINEKEIAIYPTQIKAYIDDSFDFRDNPNQTVGVWNYENIEFDSATSAAMALKYWWNKEANEKEQIQLALKYHQNRDNNLSCGAMYYHLYNLDYQNTQSYFNLGLDFIVTSKGFKNIMIPNNLDTKNLFRIIVK